MGVLPTKDQGCGRIQESSIVRKACWRFEPNDDQSTGDLFSSTISKPEYNMNLKELFLEELDREAVRTRRTLEQVPVGRDDWKLHPKSMPLGSLAGLVASMPSWIPMIIEQDQLDLSPPSGAGQYQRPPTEKLVDAHEQRVSR
jgi:hypothetical protein